MSGFYTQRKTVKRHLAASPKPSTFLCLETSHAAYIIEAVYVRVVVVVLVVRRRSAK